MPCEVHQADWAPTICPSDKKPKDGYYNLTYNGMHIASSIGNTWSLWVKKRILDSYLEQERVLIHVVVVSLLSHLRTTRREGPTRQSVFDRQGSRSVTLTFG